MSNTLPVVNSEPDLVDSLLQEQQSLTAVEHFSRRHETESLQTLLADLTSDDAEPAQARYYRSLLPATPPGPGEQYAFEVNLDQCSGCKACVVACHTLNGLEEDESWRRVGTLTIGEYDESKSAGIQHVTTACHHCEDPGCLNGCPVKAYDKDPDTGIVRHLDDQCIGCKYCTMMCPYEVPQYSERLGIVRKCDMCHNRLSVGEAPACVQSCPNEAISIRLVKKGFRTFTEDDRLASGAPVSTITKPTTQYTSSTPKRQALATPQNEGIDSVAESHWPLAVMLVATQVSVGIVIAERVVAILAAVSGNTVSEELTRYSATTALLIGGVGLNIAPLHLGQPLRAWRVFLGLRTSWLSREAVVLGKYMGALSIAVGLLWMPMFADYVPSFIVENTPSWAAVATLYASVFLGLLGLFSSAMIYIATKRQLWRMPRTLIRFFGTTVVCGPVFVAAISAFAQKGGGVAAGLFCIALMVFVAKLMWEWSVYLNPDVDLQKTDPTASLENYDRRSRRLISSHLRRTAEFRLQAGLVGIFLVVIATFLASASPLLCVVTSVLACVTIIAGEYAERLLYFQSVVYDRMPGTLK